MTEGIRRVIVNRSRSMTGDDGNIRAAGRNIPADCLKRSSIE